MHTTFDKKQPSDPLENPKVLDSDRGRGRVNRQWACFLEERAFIEDGTQVVDVGEMLIRSASSQVNLSAHSGSVNKKIKQVTRDAGTDSRAQSLGRINKAIPQLHLAGSCVRLLPISLFFI